MNGMPYNFLCLSKVLFNYISLLFYVFLHLHDENAKRGKIVICT